jgi:hypothetical protein
MSSIPNVERLAEKLKDLEGGSTSSIGRHIESEEFKPSVEAIFKRDCSASPTKNSAAIKPSSISFGTPNELDCVAVLGAGSFGTAMARVIALAVGGDDGEDSGEVVLWARRDELAHAIEATRKNEQ